MGILQTVVIDHDPVSVQLINDALPLSSAFVSHLSTDERAIDKIREQSFDIAIVAVDGSDDRELSVISRIRSFDTDLAIIVLASSPSLQSATRAITLDVSYYLSKPIQADDLRHAVEQVAKKKGLILDPAEKLHANIGNNIRIARKTRGLTLKQLSRRTDLSVSLLSQIERAESSASVSSLFKVSNALNIQLNSIFNEF